MVTSGWQRVLVSTPKLWQTNERLIAQDFAVAPPLSSARSRVLLKLFFVQKSIYSALLELLKYVRINNINMTITCCEILVILLNQFFLFLSLPSFMFGRSFTSEDPPAPAAFYPTHHQGTQQHTPQLCTQTVFNNSETYILEVIKRSLRWSLVWFWLLVIINSGKDHKLAE